MGVYQTGGISKGLPAQQYAAVVYPIGAAIYADDYVGNRIASGALNVDDTAVIQAAITAAAGESVLVKAGSYIHTGLSAPNSTAVEGEYNSTILTLKAGTDAHSIVNSDTATGANIVLKNLVVDGNKANQTNEKYGIFFDGVSNCRILNCEVRQHRMHNIGLINSDNNLIQSNYCHDAGVETNDGSGIHVSISTRTRIIDNYCYNNGVYTPGGTYDHDGDGIKIQGNNDDGTGYYNLVSGNHCCHNARRGIKVQQGNTSVTGNVCDYNGHAGIQFVNLGSRGSITGNVCRNNAYGIVADLARNVTITGNTAESNIWFGIWLTHWSATDAATAPPTYGCVVGDNIVCLNGLDGIRLTGAAYSSVVGNIVYDNATSNPAYHGIRLTDGPDALGGTTYACDNILISDNQLFNTATGQQNGIGVYGGSDYVTFSGNVLRGIAAPYGIGTTGTHIFYNYNIAHNAAGTPVLTYAGALFPGVVSFKNQGAGANPTLQSYSSTQGLTLAGNLIPAANATYNLGLATLRYTAYLKKAWSDDGVVMRSPDGDYWLVSMNNGGTLNIAASAAP